MVYSSILWLLFQSVTLLCQTDNFFKFYKILLMIWYIMLDVFFKFIDSFNGKKVIYYSNVHVIAWYSTGYDRLADTKSQGDTGIGITPKKNDSWTDGINNHR